MEMRQITDAGGQFSDCGGGDPSFALGPVESVTPDDAEDPERQVRDGRKQRILSDVEAEDVLHISGQLDEQHVPAEIVARVSDQNGPERTRSPHRPPWHRQILQI